MRLENLLSMLYDFHTGKDTAVFIKVFVHILLCMSCAINNFTGTVKQVANLLLIVVMIGAIYTHYALKDTLDKMTPALVFGLLLICRYITYNAIMHIL